MGAGGGINIYTYVACRLRAALVGRIWSMLHLNTILLFLSGTVFSIGMNHLTEGGVL